MSNEYDNLPEEIKSILDSFDDDKDIYAECMRIEAELNNVGWSFDYDLGGNCFNIKEIVK